MGIELTLMRVGLPNDTAVYKVRRERLLAFRLPISVCHAPSHPLASSRRARAGSRRNGKLGKAWLWVLRYVTGACVCVPLHLSLLDASLILFFVLRVA